VSFALFAQGSALAEVLVEAGGVASTSAGWFNNVTQTQQSLSDSESIPVGGGFANADVSGGPSYGLVNSSASASAITSTLSIAATANSGAGATGFGDPVSIGGSATAQAILKIKTSTGSPFLFRGSATGSLGGSINFYGSSPVGWSGLVQVNGTSTILVGIARELTSEAIANSSVALFQDGSANSNHSSTGQFEIDENVLLLPEVPVLFAPSGKVGIVVNYPAPISYTGQTNPNSVESIEYNPPSGSFLSGFTNVSREVFYKWNFTAPVDNFGVRVIPGFQPADIVRVSYDGQPVAVFFEAPPLPPEAVSFAGFSHGSEDRYNVGQTTVTAFGNIPDYGQVTRTFTVTVIDGSSWGVGGEGVPPELLSDSDGDGSQDWKEIAAGTSPNDSTDRFAASIQRQGDDFVISWVGAGGITYQVESISLDGSSPPVNVGSPVTATGARPLLSVTDTGALSASRSKFYRIKVVPQ
jgi:hypothetical protein